ncbi:LysR family transcriptional regulator [uncultured Amphritea sp.]|uniref:LysR family transcriptional regulator n=1 Tax=Amphritea sp. TaxID=1872502 RepID=UPI0025FB89A3|nr:LysR family transcriptional regulator [uncultured Amphritea sp.]
MHSIKHMHTFCTVVEHGGFSGAQLALGMSQPAISTHIRDFEIRLGFQLCLRGRAGFRLTEKGKITYQKCRNMLNTLDDFNTDLGELKNSLTGVLRIGLIDTTVTDPNSPVPRAIKQFYSRANDVSLTLKIHAPEELEAELIASNIHLAIGVFSSHHSALKYQHLYAEDHLFYCGKGHPLFNLDKSQITMKLLRQYPIASRSYLQQSDLHYFRKSPTPATVSNIEALAILINSGQFMGFLPIHFAQHWVDKGQMKAIDHLGLSWQSELQLVTRDSPSSQNIVKLFIQDLMGS